MQTSYSRPGAAATASVIGYYTLIIIARTFMKTKRIYKIYGWFSFGSLPRTYIFLSQSYPPTTMPSKWMECYYNYQCFDALKHHGPGLYSTQNMTEPEGQTVVKNEKEKYIL